MTTTVEIQFTGQLRIQDHTGDSKLTWDKNDPQQVDIARAQFDAFKKKGYVAWSVKKSEEKNEIARSFDPNAEIIVLTQAVVGG